jgi:hypothetical protein
MTMTMTMARVSLPSISVPTVFCLAYPFCSYIFILVDIAETVKQLNQSLSSVLDEVNRWLVKSPKAKKTVPDSPSASRCRAKMRSLEDQMSKWRSGIGQGNASRRWSTGESSVVSEQLPSLVDYEEPDESHYSRSQRGGGLEVHYESTAAENDVEIPIIVGRRKDRSASMSSAPLETSFYRPEGCCDAGPNAFRSKAANEIEELPTVPAVPAAEFTPLPGTNEGSVPPLVDCEGPGASNHSLSQRGGGLQVYYETTAAENDVEIPRIFGQREEGRASKSSAPLETSLHRPEKCSDAGPNAFRSKVANEIELPTVSAVEFTPLPGTDLEGSLTSFQMPKADYLEAVSPGSIPGHRRASMGSVPEDAVKPQQGVIGKWHARRRSSLESLPTPIRSDQMMGRRGSLGTMNAWLASPGSLEKQRPGLGSGKVDMVVGRRPSGVTSNEGYSNAGTGKLGVSIVSKRESVGSVTGLLVREESRSSVSTGPNSSDTSRASVGTGFQSSDASRASVESWVSPKSVFFLRDGSRSNAGKANHVPIGSPGPVSASIDSRKGFNDSSSTILTGDSSVYRGSKSQHTPIGSPGSVTGYIDSRKDANEQYREQSQHGSCSSDGKGINAPLGSPGSIAGSIDSRRGADGSRRPRSHRKLPICETSEAPSRTPSYDQALLSTPRSTKKRHGSGSSHRKEGSKRDLLSKDHDAELSPRSLRSGKNIGSRTKHGSENGTDPGTPRSSRRKHRGSRRVEPIQDLLIEGVTMSMISEVEAILSSPLSSTLSSSGKKSRRSDSTRHRSSRKLDSKEYREPSSPLSQGKERRVSLSSPRRSNRRSSMGTGGSSTYYSEVGADQLRGLKRKSLRRASVGANPLDVSVHNVAPERALRRQERRHRASMRSIDDSNVEEARRRESRRSSVGSKATDNVEGMKQRQSRRASMGSIPADRADEKHRRQGRPTIIDGETLAATPRSNLHLSLSRLDLAHENSQLDGVTKNPEHSVMSGSLGTFLASEMSGSHI